MKRIFKHLLSFNWQIFFIFLVFVSFYLPVLVTLESNQSNNTDYFYYKNQKLVTDGSGGYQGYTDNLTSYGGYFFQSTSQPEVSLHATYGWLYTSSEGTNTNGVIDRTVTYNAVTRTYTSSKTDLDDYDSFNAQSLFIWFKIPTKVHQGDSVNLLNKYFQVTGVNKSISFNGTNLFAIELHNTGTGSRNDAYGSFTYSYDDWYYFDPQSGFIITEKYTEHDSGFWNFQSSEFTMTQTFYITSASYQLVIDTWGPIISLLSTFFLILLIILLIVGAFIFYPKLRWKKRSFLHPKLGTVTIERIYSFSRLSPITKDITTFFGDFLEDFVNKAFLSKDVVVQVISANNMVGLGIYNKEADLSTIFTTIPEVKAQIINFLHARDFFTEIRSTDTQKDSVAIYGTLSPRPYKLIDIYQVLSLQLEDKFFFDTNIIREMRESDLPIVIALSNLVNGIATEWIQSQFFSGDIGIVAVLHNEIVGFAFASVSGLSGRLHSITVAPNFRNQGIGKQLMKARLKILFELGVTTVITEIANWNLPSLQIAYGHGFSKIGELFLETDRVSPRTKKIMRI